ncbi:MAG: LLM class flavin-dependent oxidoreductase, partial [Candidatus Saccharimonadales bacterium]
VFPKTEGGSIPVYVGVGGTPQSVVRTAKYGFAMMLAVIGGAPDRFKPYVDLYRQASKEFGHTPLPVGLHSPGFIGDTDQQARDAAWPPYKAFHTKVGASRGWPPVTRAQYEQEIDHGSLYIGSAETVARKIASAMKVLDVNRFDLVYGLGTAKATDRMKTIELYGSVVIPRVRELLGVE